MRAATLFAALALAAPAAAHDGHAHPRPAAAAAALPFPVEIRPAFALVDQTGAARTQADLAGRPWLLFFGYASCEAICDVALPRMAAAVDLLAEQGIEVTPVMVTVDPARDTVAALAAAAPTIHPRLVALTGDEDALRQARDAFQIEAKMVFEAPDGPVYAHGSFVYLVGADGVVSSVMPPVLGPERIAEIVAGHLRR